MPPANADDASIANRYRKLTHREHVLLRPDMYIGLMQPDAVEMFVPPYETMTSSNNDIDDTADIANTSTTPTPTLTPTLPRMVFRKLTIVPGLLKCVDELLMNAVDHAVRMKQDNSSTYDLVRNIKVSIDRKAGVITIANDGRGLEVAKHPDHNVFIPELLLGQLLTGTNYDDDTDNQREVAGQNGIGAKAANIMSKRFVIETIDVMRGVQYTQVFENNMSVVHPPKITRTTRKRGYTSIAFEPDAYRFKHAFSAVDASASEELNDDTCAAIARRVYDIAAITDPDVAVSLNGVKLPYKSFERFVDAFIGTKSEAVRAYESIADGRWEIAAAPVNAFPDSDSNSAATPGGFAQVSFVNGIATLRGGKHVDHVVSQICNGVIDALRRKHQEAAAHLKPASVRESLIVFVKATVPGPTFDSQSKLTLTTPVSRFGTKVELSDKFIGTLLKISGFVERLLHAGSANTSRALAKSDGKARASRIHGLPKLDDAIHAGTSRSAECTLILTEGDSAKTLAVAGLAEVGREFYGVFPLRGKILNAMDAAASKIADNAEICALKRVLGLESGKTYMNGAAAEGSLRYGRVCLMTDADADGSHISGLLMALFNALWPSLLRAPPEHNFLCALKTPVVKVMPKSTAASSSPPLYFYTLKAFEDWHKSTEMSRKFTVRYLKGLGSSTSDDAKRYFSQPMRLTRYVHDGAPSDHALTLAFDKKRADDRKSWLADYDKGRAIDPESADVTFSEFVNNELIHFSNYDLSRSIPSAIDGLKTSQRKILWAAFKRANASSSASSVGAEIKVANFAGYASDISGYHHGDTSLQAAIINMAQTFVGANNVELLEPIGQFGSRIQGGKDAASPRYTFTRLSSFAPLLFPRADETVLEYEQDDGVDVEPTHYVPIIPIVLLNGAAGIGTGYSTSVPCYNPRDVVLLTRRFIEVGMTADDLLAASDASYEPIKPWVRGFMGEISWDERHMKKGRFVSRGKYARTGPVTITVTELPVGVWTDDVKEVLDAMVQKPDIRGIVDFQMRHTPNIVDFIVTFASSDVLDDALRRRTDGGDDGNNDDGNDGDVVDVVSDAGSIASNGKKKGRPGRRVDGNASTPSLIAGARNRLESDLKLVSTRGLSTTNLHLFDADGRIKRYASPEHIAYAHYLVRKEVYVKRKAYLLETMEKEVAQLATKARFIAAVVTGEMSVSDMTKSELESMLDEVGYERVGGSFDFLTGMRMYSMTKDKVEELHAAVDAATKRLDDLHATSIETIWMSELDAFLAEWDASLKRYNDAMDLERASVSASATGGCGNGNHGGTKKRRKTAGVKTKT